MPPLRLAVVYTAKIKSDSVTADAALMPSGAKSSTVPPSRSPMPLRLMGKSVRIDTSGTSTP